MADKEPTGTPETASIEEVVENTARISTAGNDVRINAAVVGAANAERDLFFTKGAVLIANVEGNARIDKAYSDVIVAGDVTGEDFGAAVLVSRAADIKRGWIGLAITPNLDVSDNSRVIIGPKAALIIAVAMLGIFGLFMVMMYEAANRVMSWRPNLPSVHWRRWGD